ncbi:hypothetical protein PRBEI_2000670900 [Prionailurus iriomotensis]
MAKWSEENQNLSVTYPKVLLRINLILWENEGRCSSFKRPGSTVENSVSV